LLKTKINRKKKKKKKIYAEETTPNEKVGVVNHPNGLWGWPKNL
jgi:hypothetical protein